MNAMNERYDVAIVGGGPAGATAAAYLAREGVRTLLVDKATFPRDKSCGDAVCTKSVRILRELGLLAAVEREIGVRSFSQSFVGLRGESLTLPFVERRGESVEPAFAYVIRRERFDNVLFQHAKAQKEVTVVEGFAMTSLLRDGERVAGLVGTAGGAEKRFAASIVIGADGAMSRVAEEVSAYDFRDKQHDHWIGAFRIYFKGVRDLGTSMEIHFLDELLPGYFWIFPVGNGEANVGAGMVETELQGRGGKRKINLRRATYDLIANHPRFRERFTGATEVPGSFKGWQLPCGSERRKLAGAGWMLTGDAASLVDPFSGEGISNAMHSAKLAAACAVAALRDGTFGAGGLRAYEKQVWAELGDELDTAYKLQRLARHKWLVDWIMKKATRPKVREVLVQMMGDPQAARQLTRPGFYLKLLFA
jgi:menaquinone-9 beta-reductase